MKEWIKLTMKRTPFTLLGEISIFIVLTAIVASGVINNQKGCIIVAALIFVISGVLNFFLFYHSGIRFTPEKVTFASGVRQRSFRYEQIEHIDVTFIRHEFLGVDYIVKAMVFPYNGKVRKFLWYDWSKLKLNVTDKNIGQMIQTLEKYEKISVSVIGDE